MLLSLKLHTALMQSRTLRLPILVTSLLTSMPNLKLGIVHLMLQRKATLRLTMYSALRATASTFRSTGWTSQKTIPSTCLTLTTSTRPTSRRLHCRSSSRSMARSTRRCTSTTLVSYHSTSRLKTTSSSPNRLQVCLQQRHSTAISSVRSGATTL